MTRTLRIDVAELCHAIVAQRLRNAGAQVRAAASREATLWRRYLVEFSPKVPAVEAILREEARARRLQILGTVD